MRNKLYTHLVPDNCQNDFVVSNMKSVIIGSKITIVGASKFTEHYLMRTKIYYWTFFTKLWISHTKGQKYEMFWRYDIIMMCVRVNALINRFPLCHWTRTSEFLSRYGHTCVFRSNLGQGNTQVWLVSIQSKTQRSIMTSWHGNIFYIIAPRSVDSPPPPS